MFRQALTACLLALLAVATAFAEAPRYTLDTLPEKDVWAGLAIGESKVGYSHAVIRRLDDGRYEILTEMAMFLRMLGFGKSIELRIRDVVDADLRLERFESEYAMDGNTLTLAGRRAGRQLLVDVDNAGVRRRQTFDAPDLLLPAAGIGVYPLLRGLQPGAVHRYAAFSPESLQVADVEQRIEVLDGGYAVHTRLQGAMGTVRLDAAGRYLSETAMGGAMRAEAVTREQAQAWLAAARATDQDAIVALSLVKADKAIALPSHVARMQVVLEGVDLDMPSGAGQRCERAAGRWACELDSSLREPPAADVSRWLRASFTVPSQDPGIAALSREITSSAPSDEARIEVLLRWLEANIRKEGADAFSALDVLATRRAECQGHAWLYAALARAAGIPTRVVNGLVYSGEHAGFLYHTWAQSLAGGQWRGVDPTFGQALADATHIQLFEGEDYGDMSPMADLIGRVAIRIGTFEYGR
ncbi:MAG TPA: transglutaminase family protein [Burkholderiales bacterium]|nr:transglutaminase family protein [Burkholderiales bacterium]